jgi:hypothetical protein
VAGSFLENRKETIIMTHLVPRAPNAKAIDALGKDLAAIAREKRRLTSLRTCHRPSVNTTPIKPIGATQAFTPQYSARLLNDPRLSDGARRCGAKLLELAYRRDRAGRTFRGTVVYLSKALGRSERAVQNYLAQLRAGGYIRHEVLVSERARMSIGILITLLAPLFPKHHKAEWPVQAAFPGVKKDSENYSPRFQKRRRERRVPVEEWALRCMDGVFRSLMTTLRSQGALA